MAAMYRARCSGSSFDLASRRAAFQISTMQSENPILSDIVKVLNGAAGTLAGMTREARDSARERIKEAMGGLDFVSREEFDVVKDMAARARDENERLEARIAALEAKLGA